MPDLHIVQGGIENGDKDWFEQAAARKLTASRWVAPKSVVVGDDVVVFVGGYGFFATGKIISPSRPHKNWPNRYGAGLGSIKLIQPAISLKTIQRRIPGLTWANYPRSITTPMVEIANQIRKLIRLRRKTGMPDLEDDTLEHANIDELRRVALLKARPTASQKERMVVYRIRSQAVHLYVLRRADGICEGCELPAPFLRADGRHYLEPHHTTRLADDGPDHPANVIGLCPNSHRRVHLGKDAAAFNKKLIRKLRYLERT